MSDAGSALGRQLAPLRPRVERFSGRLHRNSFIRRVRFSASYVGATVDLQVGPDVTVSSRAKVTFRPGSANVLHIGEGTRIAAGVQILMKGGTVILGPRVDLRDNVILNVAGRLSLSGDNPVSWGSVIHCSRSVSIGPAAGLAERVTIADSSHYFSDPGANFYHNVRSGEVSVGANTWLCPNSVLTRTANVGDHCIVASGSVVIGVVPPGHLATGVPATTRPLDLPWMTGARHTDTGMRASVPPGSVSDPLT